MIKTKVPVYYWKKFVNPEWEPLKDSKRIDNQALEELLFFWKESEKRQAIISVYTTCIALDIREVDWWISYNVDWNDPVFLNLCKIAWPNRNLLSVISLLHNHGYTYTWRTEIKKE